MPLPLHSQTQGSSSANINPPPAASTRGQAGTPPLTGDPIMLFTWQEAIDYYGIIPHIADRESHPHIADREGAPEARNAPARARAATNRPRKTKARLTPTWTLISEADGGPRTGLGYIFDSTLGYPGKGPSPTPLHKRDVRPGLRLWSTARPVRNTCSSRGPRRRSETCTRQQRHGLGSMAPFDSHTPGTGQPQDG
jgi:hypothetical protein